MANRYLDIPESEDSLQNTLSNVTSQNDSDSLVRNTAVRIPL